MFIITTLVNCTAAQVSDNICAKKELMLHKYRLVIVQLPK